MRKHLQLKAWLLLTVFVAEIFLPASTFALGSGPSQPEMASFTPAGTSEMVDPFTGDFSYNIPLMDVEGYPVNIAYNSGVTMEQEASWVGLGWNLNVGTVNRSVRGVPDDFNGDDQISETSMKPMIVTKLGTTISSEILGKEKLQISYDLGISIIHNNYKGFGLSLENNVGVSPGSTPPGGDFIPAKTKGSVGLDINSLDGVSVNSSLSSSFRANSKKNGSMTFGGALGTGYNTRTGQSMLTLGTTAGYSPRSEKVDGRREGKAQFGGSSSMGSLSYMPIGMNTYTPYSSLKMTSSTFAFSGTIGGEIWGLHPNGNLNGSRTIQEIKQKVINTDSYGYLYLENSSDESIQDFNRDTEVTLSKEVTNLSPSTLTYDVYTVSGEGVGGMFRPFRNDIGTIGDPSYSIKASSSNSIGVELGFGGYFRGGLNISNVTANSTYKRWDDVDFVKDFRFKSNKAGSDFEKFYFKAAGDLAQSDENFYNEISNHEAIAFDIAGNELKEYLISNSGSKISQLPEKNSQRIPRSNLFSVLTANEAQYGALDKIYSTQGAFFQDSLQSQPINRKGGIRKGHHISEITQTNPGGERFVFGIPAYNTKKVEVNYATDLTPSNDTINIVPTLIGEASDDNSAGIDNYYSKVTTSPYAHSYLLTGKLSSDYRDVTGDGITQDDLGNAYKFDYTRTATSYKWRIPYSGSNYIKGYSSNQLDQKANYSYGEKEMWYLHTIQSKNQIAEFYTSPREDAVEAKNEIDGGLPTSSNYNKSYKLDSILLFDKLDRMVNKLQAVPLKKVTFEYDYSLCEGVKNNINLGSGNGREGKLTLKRIYQSYGRSNIGNQSPYEFDYSNFNPEYNSNSIDRWGNYKPINANPNQISNAHFPYTLQDSLDNANWSAAWSLNGINLPTGGRIDVEYEADDYAYVQNRRAMQMFPVIGAGKSTTFSSSNKLYGNTYLYLEAPEGMNSANTTQTELRRMLLGKDQKLNDLYFKFLTSIGSGKPFEYGSGYISGINAGFCHGDDSKIYIQINSGNPNPISKICWGIFRHNLFEVLYDQPNVNDTGLESVLKGMAANVADVLNFFVGVEDRLKKKKIANEFTLKESFIRLYSPNQFKKGGGSRVKSIYMNDNWNELSGEGENSTYGQTYEYTTTDEDGKIISSGVARYEPSVGNDENPFRTPIPFLLAEKKGHIPSIDGFQERPFGESLFPSASVGYSVVKVKNIHFGVGKTSNTLTEHEFYTAKDFPVIVRETEIDKKDSPAKDGAFTFPYVPTEKKSLFTASQGYSIVLNDMHGKKAAERNFSMIDLGTGIIKKPIGGQIFTYHFKNTSKGKELTNKVKTLTNDGYIEDKLLGTEYDLTIDSRNSRDENVTISGNVNADVSVGPLAIPLVMPSAGFNMIKDIKETKTIVITKVIQKYGLIKSVKSYTDQYSATVYNELYDGNTGEVILTRTEDEHLKEEYTYNIPAYTVANQERMGAAFVNSGFETAITNLQIDSICNPVGDAYLNPGNLVHGDEVLLFEAGANPRRAWVELEKNPKTKIECDTIIPFESTKNRLISSWYDDYGTVCGTEVICDSNSGFFKGERGELLEKVKIYHLKEKFVDSLNAINYFPLTNQRYTQRGFLGSLDPQHIFSQGYFDIYWRTNYRKRYTDARKNSADYLNPSNYYSPENSQFCSTFDTINNQQSIFASGIDLMYQITGTNLNGLDDLFEMTSPINAQLEYTIVKARSLNSLGTSSEKGKYKNWDYEKSYNSCLSDKAQLVGSKREQDLSYGLYYCGNNLLHQNYTPLGVETIKFAVDTVEYKKMYGPVEDILANPYKANYKATAYTKSSFRIEYNEETDTLLAKYLDFTQPYLIKYFYQLPGGSGIDSAFYIEKGRKVVQGEPNILYNANNLSSCEYDKYPYGYQVWGTDTVAAVYVKPICKINYRLLDKNGNYITGLNGSDKIKVIRSGMENKLSTKSGSIVATTNPVKVDLTNDTNKFIGLKGVDDGLEILNASSATYNERFEKSTSDYLPTKNPFLLGKEGVFVVDSTMRYATSRHQKASIELSRDGYYESMPDMWEKGECNDAYFPPNWKTSSGWFLKQSVSKYATNGASVEEDNILNIKSAAIQNTRGNVEFIGKNSSLNNLAYDNFENYYSLGQNGVFRHDQFTLIDQSSIAGVSVLNEGSNQFSVKDYSSLKLITNGVSHSGNSSLFLKGASSNTGIINVEYKDESIYSLEHLNFGEEVLATTKSIPIPYTTEKNNHFINFTSNLSPETKLLLSQLEASSLNTNTYSLILNAGGDSIGTFCPDSGRFTISVWFKELLKSGTIYAGASPYIEIINGLDTTIVKGQGARIEGWQKMEESFKYDPNFELKITLNGGLWGTFYDDFRIFPSKSNVSNYVYDRFTSRLTAKLDENNYTTFYLYDSEGIPSQVKRETDQGVITISESRQSISKK